MSWYTVIKTINRRRYLYLQTTYREGGKVKTKNKYIGPADDGIPFSFEPRPHDSIKRELEEARVTRDVLRDTLRNHPAKSFIPLRGDLNKQSIGGDTFAELNYQATKEPYRGRSRKERARHAKLKNLDHYLSEHGFADFEALDDAVAEYESLTAQHESAAAKYAALKREDAYAWRYHSAVGMAQNRESVTRPVPEPKKPKAPVLKMRSPPVRKPARAKVRKATIKLDKIRRPKPRNWRREVLKERRLRATEFLTRDAQRNLNAHQVAQAKWKSRSVITRLFSFRERAHLKELDYKKEMYRARLKLRRR